MADTSNVVQSIVEQLTASRARLTHITRDLHGAQLLGPRLATVNPPLWEIGHVGYFQEYWCLRYRAPGDCGSSIMPNADALYDSAKITHDTRWDLPLPDIAATRAYLAGVLERVLQRLLREPENEALRYFARLALFHEDMHAEAFHYTRQTLGYGDPFEAIVAPDAVSDPQGNRDVAFAGGIFRLGAEPGTEFVFDNEKWAHELCLAPFRISRLAVSNAEYRDFVEDGGYVRREFWDDAGWRWLQGTQLQAPRYWERDGDVWLLRRFGERIDLPQDRPVMHVNWHEANAWCRHAGRRLPTEAEWECAASFDPQSGRKRRYPWGDEGVVAAVNLESSDTVAVAACVRGDSAAGCRQLLGNVWEWTATTFGPYPGYTADPYKEYSQPWFGTHQVLRGGSFATTHRLMRNTWRNFYTPDRGDVFAGFRTCAIDAQAR